MLMRDSDDDDLPVLNRVNQSIGKAINKELAILKCVRDNRDGTDVMLFPEPLDRLFELSEKRLTQPSSFELEVASCARQLCICRRKQAEGQFASRLRIRLRASSSASSSEIASTLPSLYA